jgi:hypothetical protein
MRKVVLVVVLAIHVGFFFLFAILRSPSQRSSEREALSIAFFLPLKETNTPSEPTQTRATKPKYPKRVPRLAKSPGTTAAPQPPAPSQAITQPAPDWRRELQIAANNQLARSQAGRDEPSVLAPHDFSGVKPGSTDDSRREFGWDTSAIHRFEGFPGLGVLQINERCAIAWMVIYIFPACKIGKMPARGNLFDQMKEAPEPGR